MGGNTGLSLQKHAVKQSIPSVTQLVHLILHQYGSWGLEVGQNIPLHVPRQMKGNPHTRNVAQGVAFWDKLFRADRQTRHVQVLVRKHYWKILEIDLGGGEAMGN